MFCNKCGGALPSKGIVCPHCGTLMSKDQVEINKSLEEENRKKGFKPEYLSDKFGVKKNIEFRKVSSGNYVAIVIVLLMLIFLGVLLMVL